MPTNHNVLCSLRVKKCAPNTTNVQLTLSSRITKKRTAISSHLRKESRLKIFTLFKVFFFSKTTRKTLHQRFGSKTRNMLSGRTPKNKMPYSPITLLKVNLFSWSATIEKKKRQVETLFQFVFVFLHWA